MNEMENIIEPSHYSDRNGQSLAKITDTLNFNLGNVFKYIWRAGNKSSDTKIQDLQKAQWYLQREINNIDKPQ